MSTGGERSGTGRGSAQAPAGGLLSIGDVAKATGIGVDTLRVWERRYGEPRSIRLPSGHRRYTPDQVLRLRRIAEGIARGLRPSTLLRAGDAELDALLETPAERPVRLEIDAMLDLVRRYERAALVERLRTDWGRLEPLTFLEGRLGPLLTAVGRLWTEGELDIRHEHFLVELLEDLLRTFRVTLPADQDVEGLVLATLSGESHGLGLQMLALLAALHGVPTHLLGTDVPPAEIAAIVRETGASAVVISVSLATGGVTTDRVLGELRAKLPREVTLLVGGAGARGPRRGPAGIRYLETMEAFDTWLRDRAREDGTTPGAA